MTRDGFETYKLYLAMQRHFSTTYDFFKYNGKVNASTAAYGKRNDKYSFEKLARIIPAEDRVDFFLAHFTDNPKCWIRSMTKPEYEKYKSKLKNLPTIFRDDMELISQYDPAELMRVDNDIPLIHKLAIEKKISIETIIIMDHYYKFIDRHKEQVSIPFVFPDYVNMLIKYRPFLIQKISDIYKDIMKSALFDNK